MNKFSKDLRLIFGTPEEKAKAKAEKNNTIILDFSGLFWASYFVYKKHIDKSDDSVNFLVFLVLNNIISVRNKFPNYKNVVIAIDSGSWRKDVFKYYKAQRRLKRSEKPEEFQLLYERLDNIIEELKANLPFKFISVKKAEADDVIGVLTEYLINEKGFENILIISRDRDFKQLLKFEQVKLYDPIDNKMIEEDNPELYLINHIINGDKGDGIPNVFSEDNVFLSGKRQKAFTKKKKEELLEKGLDQFIIDNGVVQNYNRNRKLIELSMENIPSEIVEKIIKAYEEYKPVKADLGKVVGLMKKYEIKSLLDKANLLLI